MTYSGKRDIRTPRPGTLAVPSTTKPADTQERLTPVVFKGTGGYIVTGPESRQVYCFSSHDPEQMIDARDAEALLKTGLFCFNT